MELKIYNRSGELKLTVSTSSSSTWNQELMKECSVSVSFTHPSYVMLDVEDYVLLEGVKFSIKKEYKPKQKNRQTYNYSVKFYAPIHDAEQVMYLHLTDGAYEPQFSLNDSPKVHLQKWVDNMNRLSSIPVWSIGEVLESANKTVEYNNATCWDALSLMSDAFESEWWVDDFKINLTRCERGELVELGYLQGLTSLVQSENSDDVKFFTRLIPLGSTKNIDRSRYGYSRHGIEVGRRLVVELIGGCLPLYLQVHPSGIHDLHQCRTAGLAFLRRRGVYGEVQRHVTGLVAG